MAYRKTEKVLAHLAARRESLIDAAMEIVERDGVDALTIDRVAEESETSVGGIYKHFPDKTELYAGVVARVLAGDLEAMQEAIKPLPRYPIPRLYAALIALYRRFTRRRLRAAMFADPAYREGLQRALRALIEPCVNDADSRVKPLSAAILGAMAGLYESIGQGEGAAVFVAGFALHGLGVSPRIVAGFAPELSG